MFAFTRHWSVQSFLEIGSMIAFQYWYLLALVLALLAIVYGLGRGISDTCMRRGRAAFVANGVVALSAAIGSAAVVSTAAGTTLQWAFGMFAIVGFVCSSAMARDLMWSAQKLRGSRKGWT